MKNRKEKNRFSFIGVFMLMVVLLAGILTGGIAEIRSTYEKTSVYTVESVAGKRKNKKNKETVSEKKEEKDDKEVKIEKDGEYTSKEEVAAYLHEFGYLPSNYITKRDAQDLGWDNKLGNLDKVAPGKSIGGDKFGNYEELLPVQKGRKYFECDIDFDGGYRGAKRIIFSNDGLIFYTEDHYKTFEPLYDENGKVEK